MRLFISSGQPWRAILAHPVIGPIPEESIAYWGTNEGGFRISSYRRVRQRYTQSRPYTLPLPYQMDSCVVTMGGTHLGNDYVTADGNVSMSGPFTGKAQERAYGRFKNAVSSSASIGITLAERKQAISMMANRLTQLAVLVRSVKRMDIKAIRRTLKDARVGNEPIERLNRWRPTSKRWANRWLEFHFGWSPLVNDVYAAMETLSRPIPYGRVSGYGSDRQFTSQVLINNQVHVNYTHQVNTQQALFQMKYGCFVLCVNPNLHLASSLGLTNPALIAWELVPYSFVVDWFTGVGSFIQSFADFQGLHFESPWSVRFYVYLETQKYSGINWSFYNPPDGSPGYYYTSLVRTFNYTRKSVRLVRGHDTPSLPAPGITLPNRLSVSRAATAISLLLQRLK